MTRSLTFPRYSWRNPIALTEEVLVDFGFGRFLEMFEERFGRFWTTVLLALIAVAVVAVCLNLIVANLIVPTFSLVKNWGAAGLWDFIRANLSDGLITFVVTGASGFILTEIALQLYFKPRMIKRMHSEVEKTLSKSREISEQTKRLNSETKELLKEAKMLTKSERT